MTKKFIVYWAHLKRHKDIKKDGYVGITSNTLGERRRAHIKASRRADHHFARVIKKYKDEIIWDVINENISEEQALELEYTFRPNVSIGWNSIKGGDLGVKSDWYEDETNKIKHKEQTSNATKKAIAEKDSTEARSKRAKEVWEQDGYKESREGLFAGENNPQYGKFGEDHPAYGNKHTDETKEKIAQANRGKVLSIETRKKLSETRIRIMAPQKAETKKRNERIRLEKKATHKKNIELGAYKGENAGPSKISDNDRKEICLRRYEGESYNQISNDYPLGLTGIKAVCDTWGRRNGFPFKKLVAKRSR
jgi:TusA-related sulfurtransferase